MLKVRTVRFKMLWDKVVKGMGSNKLIPITSLVGIELNNGVLTLTTTDATNYLYVRENLVEGDDFYVVIDATVLNKLVGKITSEYITFDIDNDVLKVVGNGTYSIEIPVDESGEPIRFPDPYVDFTPVIESEIKYSDLKNILGTAKTSLATTMEIPCYTGYYLSKSAITTDGEQVCNVGVELFDVPVLVNATMMELITTMTEDVVKFKQNDNIIVFETPTVTIYGNQQSGIEDFNIKALNNLIEQDFESSCAVGRTEMISTLERILLFVGEFDENCVVLNFSTDSVIVTDRAGKSQETLAYKNSSNANEFSCLIDGIMLLNQLKSRTSDIATMWYQNPVCIKLTDDNITQIIALSSEE